MSPKSNFSSFCKGHSWKSKIKTSSPSAVKQGTAHTVFAMEQLEFIIIIEQFKIDFGT